jgi:hypothetical protein
MCVDKSVGTQFCYEKIVGVACIESSLGANLEAKIKIKMHDGLESLGK